MKYLKWMYNDKSEHNDFKFKIDEVIVAENWHPDADFNNTGGFNFTNEENALRWISRGDTLYDVTIPEDGEVINVHNIKTPNGIFRSNKIIISNPRKVSDELTLELYKKSKMPEYTLFESLAFLALKGCFNTCLTIIRERITKDNVALAINEYIGVKKQDNQDIECYEKVLSILGEIENDLYICLTINKDPFIKKLSNDNIINLTGQSGSGKSTYAKKNYNSDSYLIIDTDDILNNSRFNNSSPINKEIGTYLRTKYQNLPNLHNDFDLIYQEIINYCQKYSDKIIVIDCAQFHEIKDISILKGKIIILRTCIDECYNRCLNRWKLNNPNSSIEEFSKYKERKKSLYTWYKGTNTLLKKIDHLK